MIGPYTHPCTQSVAHCQKEVDIFQEIVRAFLA
jgi:hypothetical protein